MHSIVRRDMRCELNCAALAPLLASADRRYALKKFLLHHVHPISDVRTKGLRRVSTNGVGNSPMVGQVPLAEIRLKSLLSFQGQRSADAASWENSKLIKS